MEDKEKIIINNLIEDKKILWTVVIVLTGGLVGLLASISEIILNFQTLFRILACILGIFVWYCMVMNLISVTNQINEKLKK